MKEKVPNDVEEYLKQNHFEIKNYYDVFNDLKQIKDKIAVDYETCNLKVISTINKDLIINNPSPIELMKVKI